MDSQPRSSAIDRPWAVLVLLAMIAFCFVYSMLVMAPVLLQVAEEFEISVGTAGLAIAAYGIPGVLLAMLTGPFSDRHGRKRFLVGGTLVLGLGTFAASFATDFGTLIALRVAAGMGAALCAASIGATVADYFPFPERGRALAVIVGSSALAGIVGVPIAGIVAQATTWRFSVGFVGTLATLVSITVAFRLPRSAPTARAMSVGELYGLVWRHRPGLVLLIVGFLAALPWATWSAYIVVFFQTEFGLEQGIASVFVISSGVGVLVGSQIGGRVGDRIGHRRILGFVIVGASMTVFAITNLPIGLIGVTVLNFVLAGFAGSRVVSHQSLVSEQLIEARGTMMSVLSALMYAAVALGAFVGGILIDWAGFEMLGAACSAALVASAVILLLFGEPAARQEAVPCVDTPIV